MLVNTLDIVTSMKKAKCMDQVDRKFATSMNALSMVQYVHKSVLRLDVPLKYMPISGPRGLENNP